MVFEAAGMSFARHTLIMGDFMPLLEKPGRLSRKKNITPPMTLSRVLTGKPQTVGFGGIHFAHVPGKISLKIR